MHRTLLFSLDGQQLNTISYREIIKVFVNTHAKLEKQSHMVHGIFSNTLGRVLGATGGVGEIAAGKGRQR